MSDREDAEERTRLVIAGCTAVLNSSLSDDTLRAAFEAFVTRRGVRVWVQPGSAIYRFVSQLISP